MEEFTAIKPRGNMILVEKIAEPGQTEAGLELPQGFSMGLPRVRVVAVGKGKLNEDGSWVGMDLKPGDVVGHAGGKAVAVPLGGREFLLLDADQILCIFDEEQVGSEVKIAV